MLTPEQKALRATGIGASEIGALVGLDRFKSPIDVYLEKVGLAEPVEENFHMERGTFLEDGARRWYAKRTGRLVQMPTPLTLRSPTHPHVLASPDGIVFNPDNRGAETLADLAAPLCALEIKIPSRFTFADWGEPGTDEVPKYHVPQMTIEAHVLGVTATDAALCVDDLMIYTLPFNEKLCEHLCEAAERFWRDHVEPRRPPPPDASVRYAEHLEKVYPRAGELLLPNSTDASMAASRLRTAKAGIAAFEKQAQLAENVLKAMIANARGIETDEGKITWSTVERAGGVNWEAIARARGATEADIAQHSKQAITYRRFNTPRSWNK